MRAARGARWRPQKVAVRQVRDEMKSPRTSPDATSDYHRPDQQSALALAPDIQMSRVAIAISPRAGAVPSACLRTCVPARVGEAAGCDVRAASGACPLSPIAAMCACAITVEFGLRTARQGSKDRSTPARPLDRPPCPPFQSARGARRIAQSSTRRIAIAPNRYACVHSGATTSHTLPAPTQMRSLAVQCARRCSSPATVPSAGTLRCESACDNRRRELN